MWSQKETLPDATIQSKLNSLSFAIEKSIDGYFLLFEHIHLFLSAPLIKEFTANVYEQSFKKLFCCKKVKLRNILLAVTYLKVCNK